MSVWGNYLERTFHLQNLPIVEKNKQRICIELALWIMFAGIFYDMLYIILGYPKVVVGSVLSLIATLINLFAFKITRNFKIFSVMQLFIILFFGLFTHYLLGGFVDSSGLALCAVLPAIGSLLFAGRQTARLMFIIYCLGLIIVGLLEYEQAKNGQTYQLPRWLTLTFFVTNFISITTIIYFIVESFHIKILSFQSILQYEKEKSEKLLLNILPSSIIEELKTTGKIRAQKFENVSVMFTDFVNFTSISADLSPEEIIGEIDDYFNAFDDIIERNGLEKIKTIGDAYLAVCGLPNQDNEHAKKTVKAAWEINEYVQERSKNGGRFQIRIGINSGPLIAGIVGVKKFAYDIWGDTVNTASRIENASCPGKINISDSTHSLVKDHFSCTYRGKIEVKNKGQLDMYYIEGYSAIIPKSMMANGHFFQ